uniref:Uncharacterized protein n=1 Tax=Candidatus Kentrum sp. FW TaxID=2126338 RepID=A0A450S4B7_9GAMM|nr:MAG: hypothetical protein BECKFW1821B_GA0114236_100120 [Candidatus Kentron sp. FW]
MGRCRLSDGLRVRGDFVRMAWYLGFQYTPARLLVLAGDWGRMCSGGVFDRPLKFPP